MSPSLETYEKVTSNIPVKVVDKNIDGSDGATAGLKLAESEKHDQVLRVFRCLIADLCEQFGGGHPGGAMGMAAIGISLWKYVMKYSPSNPKYFNRDRFVLSNGSLYLSSSKRVFSTKFLQDTLAFSNTHSCIWSDTNQ